MDSRCITLMSREILLCVNGTGAGLALKAQLCRPQIFSPPSLIVKEALRGTVTSPGDIFKIEYRFRNSSVKYPITAASLRDTLPEGFSVTKLDPQGPWSLSTVPDERVRYPAQIPTQS
jgi:hypothetical protein